MFSILIPSYNNLPYLKLCIESIQKHSRMNHEIIVHLNEGSDGSLDFLKSQNIKFSHSDTNIGLCSSINNAAKLSTYDYLLYTHDDMYFCPDWDTVLANEIKQLHHDLFYLSGTMIEFKRGAHIAFDCGESYKNFDEKKLLNNFKDLLFYDHQGSHFAPHLISKRVWNSVSGFSEEFNPGFGSDPDFNMKLWNLGVRLFKGLNDFRVYHFGSVTTRKKISLKPNRGNKTFLLKWGITISFFKKYYLKSNTKFDGPLKNPIKNFNFFLELIFCKLKKFFFKFIT